VIAQGSSMPLSKRLTPVFSSSAITKEDLEFSVGSKTSVWEVKDPLLPVSPSLCQEVNSLTELLWIIQPNPDYIEEDVGSTYRGAGGSLVGGMTVSILFSGGMRVR
jgi:hypothetical protein